MNHEKVLRETAAAFADQHLLTEEINAKRPRYEPRLYRSPVKLPERRLGVMRIEHEHWPKGKRVPIVSFREAFCTGRRQAAVIMPEAVTIHWLVEHGVGRWMSDMPCELNQMAEAVAITQPHGDVLVGGLGLGVLPGLLHRERNTLGIKTVTVVERSKEVIELCAGRGYNVVQGDIRTYIATCPKRYDAYMLDTWAGQNEMTYWQHVLPLRRAIRQLWGPRPKVWCWKEDEMQGQVYVVLRGPNRVWHYEGLIPSMTHEQARDFLFNVGSAEWEQQHGAAVDEQMKSREARLLGDGLP